MLGIWIRCYDVRACEWKRQITVYLLFPYKRPFDVMNIPIHYISYTRGALFRKLNKTYEWKTKIYIIKTRIDLLLVFFFRKFFFLPRNIVHSFTPVYSAFASDPVYIPSHPVALFVPCTHIKFNSHIACWRLHVGNKSICVCVGWGGKGGGVVGICLGYWGYIICRAFLCTIRVSLYYIFFRGFSTSANGIGLRPIGKFVHN